MNRTMEYRGVSKQRTKRNRSSIRENKYWHNPQNRIQFLDELAKELGFKSKEQWYHITKSQITNKRGAGLLQLYNNSPSRMLISVYNDHKWIPSKFKTVSPNAKSLGYWNLAENRREFLDWLGSKLGFK